jgi:alkanesulfonate monooxygenase SsuD/methylene tetrahydromethanopterin reductase-like flavin-dependent oxidoreductase (luciferase family)
MKVGVGIDDRLRLSAGQQQALVEEAARLGYDSLWTPASVTGRSALFTCAQWWQASRAVVPEGLAVGISVVPFPAWTVTTLAAQAATLGELTGGKFVLGIGLGGYTSADFRRSLGLADVPPLQLTRDYLQVLRDLLAGRTVDYDGPALSVHGTLLGVRTAEPVPVYLAALGPRMLGLAGELADGVTPNWSSPEQLAWMRQLTSAEQPFAQYIRVCIDDDEDAARRAFTTEMLGYALARPGQRKDLGYRAHFARMGFDDVLTELEARRSAGAAMPELIDAVPPELSRRVGYFGGPGGAAEALGRLSRGLDEAMVRLISTRPGDLDSAVTAIRACQPSRWR